MMTIITNSRPLQEIGVKSLKAHLEANGIHVRAIYLDTRYISPALAADIVTLCKNSRLVGMSVMGRDVKLFAALSSRIRALGIPVVWGGIHPTALPSMALEHADYICRGDGEEPLRMLYEHVAHAPAATDSWACSGAGGVVLHPAVSLSGIPNVGYRQVRRGQGSVSIDPTLNPVTYAVPSLDEEPFPDYDFRDSWTLHNEPDGGRALRLIPETPTARGEFFRESHETQLLFYSQRGCPFHCAYCSNSLLHRLAQGTGKPWCRRASVPRIKAELRHILASIPTIDRITLNDDDLLARPHSELAEIAAFLGDEIGLPFDLNAIPTMVTDEDIGMLIAAGLRNIHIGLQTGSRRVLSEVYHRRTTPEQVLKAAYTIQRHANANTLTCYSMILDCPYEDVDDWRESLRLTLALPWPRSITHLSLAFFPGTELTERALTEGRIRSEAVHIAKRITLDFNFTYANFLFLLNRHWRIPGWLNAIALSDAMAKSPLTAPLRWLLGLGAIVPRLWKVRDYIGTYYLPIRWRYRRLDMNALSPSKAREFWYTGGGAPAESWRPREGVVTAALAVLLPLIVGLLLLLVTPGCMSPGRVALVDIDTRTPEQLREMHGGATNRTPLGIAAPWAEVLKVLPLLHGRFEVGVIEWGRSK